MLLAVKVLQDLVSGCFILITHSLLMGCCSWRDVFNVVGGIVITVSINYTTPLGSTILNVNIFWLVFFVFCDGKLNSLDCFLDVI